MGLVKIFTAFAVFCSVFLAIAEAKDDLSQLFVNIQEVRFTLLLDECGKNISPKVAEKDKNLIFHLFEAVDPWGSAGVKHSPLQPQKFAKNQFFIDLTKCLGRN